MATYKLNDSTPYEAIPAGEFILDELKDRNMKQSDLAEATGIPKPILNNIIKGKRSLTAEMALLIEKAIGIPAHILMGMQTQYEIDTQRIAERTKERMRYVEMWRIIAEYISIPFFRDNISLGVDVKKNVHTIFMIFDVTTLDAFVGKASDEKALAFYKKSEKLQTDAKALFSWKFYSMYLSSKIELKESFKKEKISAVCKELNEIFLENFQTEDKVRSVLAENGIKFLVVHPEKDNHLPVDGMSFWEGENPAVVVSRRKDTIDYLAFSIFHELGHIQQHLEKDKGEALINLEGDVLAEIEAEANRFAMDAILPQTQWKEMIRNIESRPSGNLYSIIRATAKENRVNPQLLFGRYQFEHQHCRIKRAFESKIL